MMISEYKREILAKKNGGVDCSAPRNLGFATNSFFSPYIFATRCYKPVILQTLKFCQIKNSQSLKYKMFSPSSSKI